MKRYQSFAEFYPFYLSQHQNPICRVLHVIGSLGVLALIGFSVLYKNPWFLLACLPMGYGFAWIGHFFFEKNRPATFTYPLYSFIGDWVMLKDVLTGQIQKKAGQVNLDPQD